MQPRWDIRKHIASKDLPDKIVAPIDGAEMVLVSKGHFTMGITEEQLVQIYLLDEKPPRERSISIPTISTATR